jgi:glyoxylase-like metal-dependent hydrolase (beta-lactamase superfamily II)
MKLLPLNITNFKIDGGAMFGVVPKTLWQRTYPADDANLCSWALRSLVVEVGKRVILIDDGFGDKQDDKFFSHFHLFGGEGLLDGLANLGYHADDITDVVLTHLHYDHCGGGVRVNSIDGSYETVFPNAKFHISRAQWEWAINPNAREADSFLKENILPMYELGLVNFIDGDCFLTDGVELRIFNGHTKGQIIPIIHHPKGGLVFVADLFPSTSHIPLPYIMSYDVEPMVTLREKEDFLEESLAKGYTYFFQHDFYTECCTLHQTKKGIRADRRFPLDGFLK